MNNGRIWCVVNPTVGLPLFLGAVALTSLTVHHGVLHNTTWVADFFKGSSRAKVSLENTTSPVASLSSTELPGFAINVVPTKNIDGATSFAITVTPKSEGSSQTALVTTASQ